ncbi:uncharacterized protein LOC101845602 [Aplysia californica]|uniref:Uncharacterized protein LOC101845602 n=1 Tax=Aplysia californica TaxID=6500 RepID=A0ABM0JEC3_APLCA|nr:uncharacterized protein LOC101845602 [Aplysia californica]
MASGSTRRQTTLAGSALGELPQKRRRLSFFGRQTSHVCPNLCKTMEWSTEELTGAITKSRAVRIMRQSSNEIISRVNLVGQDIQPTLTLQCPSQQKESTIRADKANPASSFRVLEPPSRFALFNSNLNASREAGKSKGVQHRRPRKRKPPVRGQLVARSIRTPNSSYVRKAKSGRMRASPTVHAKSKKKALIKGLGKSRVRTVSTLKKQNISNDFGNKKWVGKTSHCTELDMQTSKRVMGEESALTDTKEKKRKKRRMKRDKMNVQSASLLSPGLSHSIWKDMKDDLRRSSPHSSRRMRKTPVSPAIIQAHACGPPCPSNVSGQDAPVEWPSLSDAYRLKGLVKDAATEIVKNKQSGSVTRMTRQRWADIVASRSKEKIPFQEVTKDGNSLRLEPPRQNTWAAVAASSYAKAQSQIPPETASASQRGPVTEAKPTALNDRSSRESLTRSRRRRKNMSTTYRDKLLGGCVKGKGKPQSLSFYRRLAMEGRRGAKMRRNKKRQKKKACTAVHDNTPSDMAPDKTVVVPKVGAREEVNPVKRREATSRDNNGKQAWSIDNMPVVYTKPASSVISLNEPQLKVKRHRKGNKNKCNNRDFSLADFITSAAKNKRRQKDEKPERKNESSGSDLCTLLSSISFHSEKNLEDGECSYSEKRTRKEQKSLPCVENTSPHQLKRTKQAKRHNKADGETKKVSLRYRALLHREEGRLDVKAVSEIHTRNKRAEALLGNKCSNRDKVKLQRQERQHRSHNEQRSPTQTSINVTKNNEPSQAINHSEAQGTSKDFTSSCTNTVRKSKASNDSVEGTGQMCTSDKRDANNSFVQMCSNGGSSASFNLLPIASDFDVPLPLHFRSEPDLTVRPGLLQLDVQPVPTDCLDIKWWHSYLFQQTGGDTGPEEPSTSSKRKPID